MMEPIGAKLIKKPSLEHELWAAFKTFSGEPNDDLTRSYLKASLRLVMERRKAKNTTWVSYHIICDETNNPQSVIAAGDLRCRVEWIVRSSYSLITCYMNLHKSGYSSLKV